VALQNVNNLRITVFFLLTIEEPRTTKYAQKKEKRKPVHAVRITNYINILNNQDNRFQGIKSVI